ncbi:hypothetical protein ACWEWU_14545 [Staphylococcus xylosus]
MTKQEIIKSENDNYKIVAGYSEGVNTHEIQGGNKMINKASKRPVEVEYIEFKGQENFREVAEFLNSEIELRVKLSGKEYIQLQEGRCVWPGMIFYREISPTGNYSNNWDVINKEIFFKLYKDQ